MELVIQQTARDAANMCANIIGSAIREKPEIVLGLATGRTMEPLYAALAERHRRQGLDFAGCVAFALDEYVGLGPAHEQSYSYYLQRHLFDQVGISPDQIRLLDGLAPDLDAEAQRYEQEITARGGIDLQLVGMGNNGHIGFNEPGSSFGSRTRPVPLTPETIAQNAEVFGNPAKVPSYAITMGVATILEAGRCVMLVTGSAKAGILARAMESSPTTEITASALQLHPDCLVIADKAAASSLRQRAG